MNNLPSITLEDVKQFIKNNKIICVLLVATIVLFVLRSKFSANCDEISSQMDSINLQVKQMEKQINMLRTVESDLKHLEGIKVDIVKKCLNFGKNTSTYKFFNQLNAIFKEHQITSTNSITKSFNLSKKQNLTLEQDLSPFNGDLILVEYTMVFKSDFKNLMGVLQRMEHLDRLIRLKQLDIRCGEANTKSGEIITKDLSVNLVFSILGKISLKEGANA